MRSNKIIHLDLGELDQKSVKELREIALQLDAGMFRLIPDKWKKVQRITTFCAFQLLYQELQKVYDKLSPETKAYTDRIGADINNVMCKLTSRAKRNAAIYITDLYNYAGKLERNSYPIDTYQKVMRTLKEKGISTKAQLAWNKLNHQPYLLPDQRLVAVIQEVIGHDMNATESMRGNVNECHISLDWIDDASKSQCLLEKFKAKFGSRNTLNESDNTTSDKFEYVNYLVDLEFVDLYNVVPTDYWKLHDADCLKVKFSDQAVTELDSLLREDEDYWYHVVVRSTYRPPHPALVHANVKSIAELLTGEVNGKYLRAIFSLETEFEQINQSLENAIASIQKRNATNPEPEREGELKELEQLLAIQRQSFNLMCQSCAAIPDFYHSREQMVKWARAEDESRSFNSKYPDRGDRIAALKAKYHVNNAAELIFGNPDLFSREIDAFKAIKKTRLKEAKKKQKHSMRHHFFFPSHLGQENPSDVIEEIAERALVEVCRPHA